MLAINLKFDLQEIVCGNCGVVHAIPQDMYDTAKREGGFWHCPNGHSRGWKEGSNQSDMKRLQAELEQERTRKNNALARVNEEAAANRELSKQLKGTKTRLKNQSARIKHGVCPCCSRTFKQLAAHMANKHPEYTP